MSEIDTKVAAWNDAQRPTDERVDGLLAAMTLREKVKQLGSTWPDAEGAGGDVAPLQDTLLQAEPIEDAIVDGLGHLTRVYGTAPVAVADGRRKLIELQNRTVAANRFGIPAIAHEECLTGVTAWTATVFPTPLAWAATNDPDLIEQMGIAIGKDLRALGIHQGLAPVLDVVRDYRWGRVEETMGEDPALVAELATAYVRGLQSSGVIATLKHFAGYSASRAARNHAPVSMGTREFTDVLLPPFERAVRDGRARSVMNSYSDIDGMPPAADRSLLTTLLRDDWEFDGTVVSDYWSIPFLESLHHVASSTADAGVMALNAGLDVELPHTLAFSTLEEEVESGRLSEEIVDIAARRVLRQKIELGLLDEGWTPETDGAADRDLDSDHNRDLARRIAEESVILLENGEGMLPLTEPRSLAVIGPGVEDSGCLFGCYSFPNHVIPGYPGYGNGIEAPTVADAIRAEFPCSDVRVATGVSITGEETHGIDEAASLARSSDVTVLVVGDRSGMFGNGTSGEGCDVATLELPGKQRDLAEAVFDASDRVVLVVLSGRPYAVGDLASRAAASLQVFFPGEEGGRALADILSGRVEPSGRLPVQIPGSLATQPGTYLAAPLAQKSDGVSNLDPTPAYPFGHGLSYSTLGIRNIRSVETASTDGSLDVTVEVTNDGERRAWHVPQLYVSDPVASVVQPVRRRITSARVLLEAGESAHVTFNIPMEALAFSERSGRRIVEPGLVEFIVAQSAGDSGCSVAVDLVGPVVEIPHRDQWPCATIER